MDRCCPKPLLGSLSPHHGFLADVARKGSWVYQERIKSVKLLGRVGLTENVRIVGLRVHSVLFHRDYPYKSRFFVTV